jgi:hypothetical protein
MKRLFPLIALAAVASVFAVRPRAQVVIAQSTNAVVQTTYYRPYRITFQFAVDGSIAITALNNQTVTQTTLDTNATPLFTNVISDSTLSPLQFTWAQATNISPSLVNVQADLSAYFATNHP